MKLSPLQLARYQYNPKLPGMLRNGISEICVKNGDATQSVDAVGLAVLNDNSELLLGLQLGTAGTDDVEAAGVAVSVDVIVLEDNEVIVQQAAGAALEADQDILGAQSLQSIIQAADNVVTAGCLATGQDYANNLLLSLGSILTLLEGDLILAVSIGEQSLDLLLISDALGGTAVLNADLGDAVSEHAGQLGSILVSCNLQRGQFHFKNTP